MRELFLPREYCHARCWICSPVAWAIQAGASCQGIGIHVLRKPTVQCWGWLCLALESVSHDTALGAQWHDDPTPVLVRLPRGAAPHAALEDAAELFWVSGRLCCGWHGLLGNPKDKSVSSPQQAPMCRCSRPALRRLYPSRAQSPIRVAWCKPPPSCARSHSLLVGVCGGQGSAIECGRACDIPLRAGAAHGGGGSLCSHISSVGVTCGEVGISAFGRMLLSFGVASDGAAGRVGEEVVVGILAVRQTTMRADLSNTVRINAVRLLTPRSPVLRLPRPMCCTPFFQHVVTCIQEQDCCFGIVDSCTLAGAHSRTLLVAFAWPSLLGIRPCDRLARFAHNHIVAVLVLSHDHPRQGYSLHDAFVLARTRRPVVTPNLGFMEKLCELEEPPIPVVRHAFRQRIDCIVIAHGRSPLHSRTCWPWLRVCTLFAHAFWVVSIPANLGSHLTCDLALQRLCHPPKCYGARWP